MSDVRFRARSRTPRLPAPQNGREPAGSKTQPSPPQPCLLPDFETLVSSPLPQVVASDPRAVDRHLVARCIDGDGTAERALYDAHVERISRQGQRVMAAATRQPHMMHQCATPRSVARRKMKRLAANSSVARLASPATL